MSFVLLGILNSQAAGAGGGNFLFTAGDANQIFTFRPSFDSSGNFYSVGYHQVPNDDHILLTKYDSAGTLILQRSLSGNSDDQQGFNGATDSSDNVFVAGTSKGNGLGDPDGFVAKYNSSGTLQWQRALGVEFRVTDFRSAITDSSGNVYVVGRMYPNDSLQGVIAKYNSSGTLQWQRQLAGVQYRDVTFDVDGNIQIAGLTNQHGEGSFDWSLVKYSPAGSISYQKTFGDASSNQARAIASDSFGFSNQYVVGENVLAKFNRFGSLQWQKTLGNSGDIAYNSVGVSEDGYVIYAVGTTTVAGEGSDDTVIAAYNLSGSLLWQRIFGSTGSDILRISQIVGDTIYLTGYTTSTSDAQYDILGLSLPTDGSGEGTYTLNGFDFVYAASSFTASSGSYVDDTSQLSESAGEGSEVSVSLTSSTPSLTQTITNF